MRGDGVPQAQHCVLVLRVLQCEQALEVADRDVAEGGDDSLRVDVAVAGEAGIAERRVLAQDVREDVEVGRVGVVEGAYGDDGEDELGAGEGFHGDRGEDAEGRAAALFSVHCYLPESGQYAKGGRVRKRGNHGRSVPYSSHGPEKVLVLARVQDQDLSLRRDDFHLQNLIRS